MDDCIFCNELNTIYEDAFWKAIYDKYPVSKGHALIISKKHFENYFELEVDELFSLHMAIQNVKKIIDKNYHPDGYNILGFPNIWDEKSEDQKCAFFVPSWTNLSAKDNSGKRLFMDEDGNSLKEVAIQFQVEERNKVKEGASE